MAAYKLYYFNVRGIGEMMRYIFADLGLDHEDHLIDRTTWPNLKPEMEFGQMPCLRHGDLQLVQSGAIIRYLARKHDLYGEGEVEAARVDMIHDGQNDLRTKYLMMIYQNYDEGKQPFIESLPGHLAKFEGLLKQNNEGKGGFVGSKTTFADYSVFDLLDNLLVLSPDCLDAFASLKAFHHRMASRGGIAKHRETDAFKSRPLNGNGKQ